MKNKQPIGAYANIRWLDTNEEVDGYYFSFGEYDYEVDEDFDSYGVRDDRIFFYCDGEHDLKSYTTAGGEDFVVLNYELEYAQDDLDIEHANLMNELEHNK
jgi:hypothetical protein